MCFRSCGNSGIQLPVYLMLKIWQIDVEIKARKVGPEKQGDGGEHSGVLASGEPQLVVGTAGVRGRRARAARAGIRSARPAFGSGLAALFKCTGNERARQKGRAQALLPTLGPPGGRLAGGELGGAAREVCGCFLQPQ